MEVIRESKAAWRGDMKNGEGQIRLGSNAYTGAYSYHSRTTEQSPLTNPEELIAAAHAGCFSMAFSGALSKAGFPPTEINTSAKVHLAKEAEGLSISEIDLETMALVPNISEEEFMKIAEYAKDNCPVSKALKAVKINFKAKLS